MGTHPIFESDFDCLTDWVELSVKKYSKMASSQMEYILQNMQKELEAQVEKVTRCRNEKENVGKRIGQFEAQLSETKVVQSEWDLLGDDSVVYKLLGPVLVKQDKEEAVSTVKNRADYMESELKSCEKSLIEIGKRMEKEQAALTDLQIKAQQVQKALQQGQLTA